MTHNVQNDNYIQAQLKVLVNQYGVKYSELCAIIRVKEATLRDMIEGKYRVDFSNPDRAQWMMGELLQLQEDVDYALAYFRALPSAELPTSTGAKIALEIIETT